MSGQVRFQRILGVRFLIGSAWDAIGQVEQNGGLVVVPSAPTLKDIATNRGYREAVLGADFAIADSALMVLLWNLIQNDRIPKLSGLKYLRVLLNEWHFRLPGATLWVMPSEASAQRNAAWLRQQGFEINDDNVYVAPIYGASIDDPELLRRIEALRPRHVVMGIGGGVQERVGFYLKRNLSYLPAIHCIGAAIAFLTGEQVSIPVWVDYLGLGWLWRSLSNPRLFVPRYWEARALAPLLFRYRDQLPTPQFEPPAA